MLVYCVKILNILTGNDTQKLRLVIFDEANLRTVSLRYKTL